MGLTRGYKNQSSKISLASEKWKNRANRVKLRVKIEKIFN